MVDELKVLTRDETLKNDRFAAKEQLENDWDGFVRELSKLPELARTSAMDQIHSITSSFKLKAIVRRHPIAAGVAAIGIGAFLGRRILQGSSSKREFHPRSEDRYGSANRSYFRAQVLPSLTTSLGKMAVETVLAALLAKEQVKEDVRKGEL
jgi:hypothetical protein